MLLSWKEICTCQTQQRKLHVVKVTILSIAHHSWTVAFLRLENHLNYIQEYEKNMYMLSIIRNLHCFCFLRLNEKETNASWAARASIKALKVNQNHLVWHIVFRQGRGMSINCNWHENCAPMLGGCLTINIDRSYPWNVVTIEMYHFWENHIFSL